MPIRFKDLPPELQRRAVEAAGLKPRASRKRPAPAVLKSRLMKVCACGSEIFRPDGLYPEICAACGQPFQP